MRSTYVIVAVVLAAGIIAFISMGDGDSPEESTTPSATKPGEKPATPSPKPSLKRNARSTSPAKAASKTTAKRESAAQKLLTQIADAERAGNNATRQALRKKLRAEHWDTLAARRHAVAEGRALYGHANESARGTQRVQLYDRARRLMSRGLFLPEMFTKDQRDTAERTQLIAAIQAANRVVMTWGSDIEGVTASYKIATGMTPAKIVFRKNIVTPEPLRIGPNAVMYWNMNGNLDPSKLRAGRTFKLPLEELTTHVYLERYRLAVFIGDWFVKEWRVGVGLDGRDTPVGSFQVHSKEENPVWYAPNGKIIHPGPQNELGSRWIAIHDPIHGTLALEDGIGIHGTNKPATVGTRCSNGCVRLLNRDAEEIFWWVRTGNGGGKATRVHIHGPGQIGP